jgi:hypothetical protein
MDEAPRKMLPRRLAGLGSGIASGPHAPKTGKRRADGHPRRFHNILLVLGRPAKRLMLARRTEVCAAPCVFLKNIDYRVPLWRAT